MNEPCSLCVLKSVYYVIIQYTCFVYLVDTSISEVDEVVGFADPVETVKKLKAAATANKMAYVFTDIKYANLYHEALKKEKSFSMPNSAVVSELLHTIHYVQEP